MEAPRHIIIQHSTRHHYTGPVSFSDHGLYLKPTEGLNRKLLKFEVATVPASRQRWVKDVHGNAILVCNFGLFESQELSFETLIEMEVANENPFDFVLEPYAIGFPFDYTPADQVALSPFMGRTGGQKALKVLDWFYRAVDSPNKHTDVVQFLTELNSAVRRDIDYVRRDEEGIQSPDQTLLLKTGSCRDMAVLFIAVARQLGFAARFVSGYLYDPPVDASGEEHMFNRAVGSMHAWAEVYLPGAGWKGFDPTNGILANGYFIPTAVSHAPNAIDPIQGKYFSNTPQQSTMEVDLKIETLS